MFKEVIVDDYNGYVPFYCTRKAPIIQMTTANDSVSVGALDLGPDGVIDSMTYTMGCGYYLKEGGNNWESYDTNLPTSQVNVMGGNNDNYTSMSQTNRFGEIPTVTSLNATKGFRRFRVYLEKPKGNPYWVVGMNANNEKYYNDDLLTNLEAFFTPSNVNPTWANDMKAGATDAIAKAEDDNAANVDKVQIGSSEGYFNFHPAGFVQGFGGLPKTSQYFDIQMGHMIDKSYLSRGIFFLMATTNETNTRNNTSTPSCT